MSDRRTRGRATRALVTAAAASYAINAAFGAAVSAGVIDNGRIRWVHHALFFTTASFTAVALAASAVEGRSAGVALLPAVGPLAALPYVGGDVSRHAALAGLAAPAFVAAVVLAWRSR